jgi:hypothetical protein
MASGSASELPALKDQKGSFVERFTDHPAAQWWSVDTWTKAGDLALKLLAIVGAIAALNLLTVSPKLSVDVRCRQQIDTERVTGLYQQRLRSPPSILTQSMNLALKRNENALNGEGVSTRCAQTDSPESILRQRNQVLVGGHTALNREQFVFARDALRQAESVVATVTITNHGKASASSVAIEAPPVFVRTARHEGSELAPGDATYAQFLARQGEEQAALGSVLTFRVHSDRKLAVDIRSLLILLAVLAGVFLVPALAIDFFRFNASASKRPTDTRQRGKRRNGHAVSRRKALPSAESGSSSST